VHIGGSVKQVVQPRIPATVGGPHRGDGLRAAAAVVAPLAVLHSGNYVVQLSRRDRPSGAAGMPAPSVSLRVGPHGHIVCTGCAGESCKRSCAVEDSQWRDDGCRSPQTSRVRALRGWGSAVCTDLFDAATEAKWALLDHPVPPCGRRAG